VKEGPANLEETREGMGSAEAGAGSGVDVGAREAFFFAACPPRDDAFFDGTAGSKKTA
jgi:hypothetical protein